MKMYIYELDGKLYSDLNAPKLLKGCITHVLEVPTDARHELVRGTPRLILPPTSHHAPRITLTLEIALFAARKKTIVGLHHNGTIDGPPQDYATSA